MTTGGAPIRFHDERGVRWTVTRQAGSVPGVARLDFESTLGERRTCEVVELDEATWPSVNEQSWQLLLRGADEA